MSDADFSSKILGIELDDKKVKNQIEIDLKKALSDISIEETKRKLESIQPGLIEAMISLAGVSQTEILARNLKEQKNGLSALFDSSGGINSIIETIKGTPLESIFNDLMVKYNDLKTHRNK